MVAKPASGASLAARVRFSTRYAPHYKSCYVSVSKVSYLTWVDRSDGKRLDTNRVQKPGFNNSVEGVVYSFLVLLRRRTQYLGRNVTSRNLVRAIRPTVVALLTPKTNIFWSKYNNTTYNRFSSTSGTRSVTIV